MKALEGRRALITGASAGIGKATVERFVAEGAQVVAAARRKDRLEALARELGSAVTPLVLDVKDHAAVHAALSAETFDVVVVNAGLGRGVAPLQSADVNDWNEMIDTNVKGLLHVIRETLAPMLTAGRGDMVLVGSVAGRQVYPGGNVYCSTKHAVRALYEGLRLDAGGKGVRFTTVDPGMVETEFSLVRFHGDEERASQVYSGFDALKATDVADAITFCVSRPKHVNIGELVLWPTDQASTTIVHRDG